MDGIAFEHECFGIASNSRESRKCKWQDGYLCLFATAAWRRLKSASKSSERWNDEVRVVREPGVVRRHGAEDGHAVLRLLTAQFVATRFQHDRVLLDRAAPAFVGPLRRLRVDACSTRMGRSFAVAMTGRSQNGTIILPPSMTVKVPAMAALQGKRHAFFMPPVFSAGMKKAGRLISRRPALKRGG